MGRDTGGGESSTHGLLWVAGVTTMCPPMAAPRPVWKVMQSVKFKDAHKVRKGYVGLYPF